MAGGLYEVFSCQRCNKLSIAQYTKKCELKKKKTSYYINSGLQTKGAAKRLPTILTYMYFIQRKNRPCEDFFFFGASSKSGQTVPRLRGGQKKLTSAAKRAKMELSRNQIITKGKAGVICTPRIAQWEEKSNPRTNRRKNQSA